MIRQDDTTNKECGQLSGSRELYTRFFQPLGQGIELEPQSQNAIRLMISGSNKSFVQLLCELKACDVRKVDVTLEDNKLFVIVNEQYLVNSKLKEQNMVKSIENKLPEPLKIYVASYAIAQTLLLLIQGGICSVIVNDFIGSNDYEIVISNEDLVEVFYNFRKNISGGCLTK